MLPVAVHVAAGSTPLIGQRYIGNAFYTALMQAYASYRQHHEGQPLPAAITAEP